MRNKHNWNNLPNLMKKNTKEFESYRKMYMIYKCNFSKKIRSSKLKNNALIFWKEKWLKFYKIKLKRLNKNINRTKFLSLHQKGPRYLNKVDFNILCPNRSEFKLKNLMEILFKERANAKINYNNKTQTITQIVIAVPSLNPNRQNIFNLFKD